MGIRLIIPLDLIQFGKRKSRKMRFLGGNDLWQSKEQLELALKYFFFFLFCLKWIGFFVVCVKNPSVTISGLGSLASPPPFPLQKQKMECAASRCSFLFPPFFRNDSPNIWNSNGMGIRALLWHRGTMEWIPENRCFRNSPEYITTMFKNCLFRSLIPRM